jgi:Uma2 family endonuclease
MSTAAHRRPLLTLDPFLDFYDSRPDSERWELIDGAPIMMPPPRIGHQWIAGNLLRHLDAALAVSRPTWRAVSPIGVVSPDVDTFRPEPDVAVVDRTLDPKRIHAERFYLAAEVLSPGDRPHLIATKLDFYRSHGENRTILLIRQDVVSVDLHERGLDDVWAKRTLSSPTDVLVLAEIGSVCTLAELYRDAES